MCSKCNGSGDMGLIASSKCNVCSGTGNVELNDGQTLLYEWCEGYFDEETELDWLERQLKKLMKVRKEELKKK